MSPDEDILLIYDKECPACDYYCKLVRMRESVGNFILVNARDAGPIMDEITAAGLDIDQGMVLKIVDSLYYGSDAIHTLSVLGTRSGFYNRLTFWCFRSQRVSRVLYPIFRAMRNLLLKALGKTKINNLGLPDNRRF